MTPLRDTVRLVNDKRRQSVRLSEELDQISEVGGGAHFGRHIE